MNLQVFQRRIVYIVAMVLLLFPIYVLGQPSVRRNDGSAVSPGGALAQLRSKYELGQADLGSIDPASESMRLATLGLRGVAVSILWQRAEYFKREQFWDNYSATLNQITKLEPHFVKVWDFLSWNLSYNISVEFDDYRQRYAWVKKGIDYLLTGTKYNRKKTDLPYELGWKFGNKFGVSDEKVQFRQLYRMDKDWHDYLVNNGIDVTQQSGLGPDNYPDSWLSGALCYQNCYDMVIQGSNPCKSTNMFYRMGPMWKINHASHIETEGHLGFAAKNAWSNGAKEWDTYGNRVIRSTWGEDLKMKDITFANQSMTAAKKALMEFCAEKATEMRAKREEYLTVEEKTALAIPDLERTGEQVYLAMQAEAKLQVPYRDLAAAMPDNKQFAANELAIKVKAAEELINHIEIYRNQVNYSYWEMRCAAEQTEEALAARAALFEAGKLLEKGMLEPAIEKYDVAWKNWADLFNQFPSMMTDDAAEDVGKAVKRYKQLIDKRDLPKDFPLNDFLRFREEYEASNSDPRLTKVLAEWSTNPDRGAWFDRIRKTRTDAEAAAKAAENAPTSETLDPPTPNPTPKPEPDKKQVPEAPKAAAPDAGNAPAPAAPQKQPPTEPKAEQPKAEQPDAGKAPSPGGR